MKHQVKLRNGRVKCTICPRNCNLDEGQIGFCNVRKNEGGEIVLRTYGYNTGLVIDPIEKKPLYHFYPSSEILSFGTLGCNMGCKFCQNWHLSRSKMREPRVEPKTPTREGFVGVAEGVLAEPFDGDIGQSRPWAEMPTGAKMHLNENKPDEIAHIALEKGCKSVGFTYNEPTIFFEYAIDTALECHKFGIKTVAVSAGYINPEPRAEFFAQMDAVNIDLKGFSEEFYRKICLAELQPVLETIKYIKHQTNCWLELTTLLIEGENDDDEMLKRQCDWIVSEIGVSTPLHFSAFYPAYKFSDRAPTRIETLFRAQKIAKEAGIRYVYCGNISDDETSTTYCHNCNSALIKRHLRGVFEYNLEAGGHCKFCDTLCAGVFD